LVASAGKRKHAMLQANLGFEKTLQPPLLFACQPQAEACK
jgi:hypothetical protein